MKITQTDHIEIVVNGAIHALPYAMPLPELLEFLGVARDRVAVELDGAIVRKQDWPATMVDAASSLEIVQFVGGG